MALNLSPGIVTNGLAFCYDMYNTQKSFKGAPTTNVVSGASTLSGWSNYWRTDYNTIFQTEFGTLGNSISGNPSWNGMYKSITLPSTGTYTFSAWFRYWGGTSSNNGAQVYVSGWGGGDSATGIDKSLVGVWQRASITLNCTNTSLTFYIISYGGDSSGRADCSTWDFTMPQVESGSFATGFVDGTRSSTQALVDLTNTNTITASSLTYSSDGTFSFNGSSDYISIPNSSNFYFAGDFAVDGWTKRTSNAIGGAWEIGYYYNGILFRPYLSDDLYINGTNYGNIAQYMPLNTNCHFSLTRIGTTCTLYVNGISVWSATISGVINSASEGMYIGKSRHTSGQYYTGSIQNIKVYKDRGLTVSEVQQNFNAQRGRYGV